MNKFTFCFHEYLFIPLYSISLRSNILGKNQTLKMSPTWMLYFCSMMWPVGNIKILMGKSWTKFLMDNDFGFCEEEWEQPIMQCMSETLFFFALWFGWKWTKKKFSNVITFLFSNSTTELNSWIKSWKEILRNKSLYTFLQQLDKLDKYYLFYFLQQMHKKHNKSHVHMEHKHTRILQICKAHTEVVYFLGYCLWIYEQRRLLLLVDVMFWFPHNENTHSFGDKAKMIKMKWGKQSMKQSHHEKEQHKREGIIVVVHMFVWWSNKFLEHDSTIPKKKKEKHTTKNWIRKRIHKIQILTTNLSQTCQTTHEMFIVEDHTLIDGLFILVYPCHSEKKNRKKKKKKTQYIHRSYRLFVYQPLSVEQDHHTLFQ